MPISNALKLLDVSYNNQAPEIQKVQMQEQKLVENRKGIRVWS